MGEKFIKVLHKMGNKRIYYGGDYVLLDAFLYLSSSSENLTEKELLDYLATEKGQKIFEILLDEIIGGGNDD